MVTDNPDSHGKDFREGGTPYKPEKNQINGFRPGVNLVPTGGGSVQEESDGRRVRFLGAEEN